MVNFFNPNIGLFFFPPHQISTKILAKTWYTVAFLHPPQFLAAKESILGHTTGIKNTEWFTYLGEKV